VCRQKRPDEKKQKPLPLVVQLQQVWQTIFSLQNPAWEGERLWADVVELVEV